MKKTISRSSMALAVAAALGTLPANASVNVQNYTSAANSTYTLTEDAMLEIAPRDSVWRGSRMFFSANYNWLNDPLIETNTQHSSRTGTLIDGIQTLDLTFGYFLLRELSLNASAPINLVHVPGTGNQFALGDSRVFAKWRLTGDNAIVAVSLIPELRLPTGDQALFLSDGSLSPGVSLAFEHDFGLVRAAANVGYRYAASAQFRDLSYTQRLPMSLGLFAPIGPRWGINAEASGALVLPRDRFNNPGEVYTGARYQWNRDLAVLGGVGLGSFNSQAGNDIRVSMGLRFSPMPAERIAEVAPVPAPAPAPAPVAAPRVVFTPKEIRISEEVKFEHGSAVLTASGKNLLDEVAMVMKRNKEGYKKVLIEGHTNDLGSYPYNQTLSERRAESVREYLASRGINFQEMMTIGYGKTKPKNVGKLSKDARLAANRRVEFKVIN